MKASPESQLALLEMQECDTALARLSFEAKNLPLHAQIEEISSRRDDLTRIVASLQGQVGDFKRLQERNQGDLEKVQARHKVQTQRLEAGQGDLRELRTMQEEIAVLNRRVEKLEEEMLQVEEDLEETEGKLASARSTTDSMTSEIESLRRERDQQVAQLRADAQPYIERRKKAMEIAGAELTAEYDAIRKATGGIGAVELRGRVAQNVNLQFTPTEWEKIRNAAPDEVVTSEDMEWILVRRPAEVEEAK
ncbi:hypothetical protein KRX54_06120 [Actinomycetaceae bacterium TAE3-ERU4]|nr:hypothetical protein [Actinomycetaceae bacterium TAE3-ERU4]